jgi:hypothetical protein
MAKNAKKHYCVGKKTAKKGKKSEQLAGNSEQ